MIYKDRDKGLIIYLILKRTNEILKEITHNTLGKLIIRWFGDEGLINQFLLNLIHSKILFWYIIYWNQFSIIYYLKIQNYF